MVQTTTTTRTGARFSISAFCIALWLGLAGLLTAILSPLLDPNPQKHLAFYVTHFVELIIGHHGTMCWRRTRRNRRHFVLFQWYATTTTTTILCSHYILWCSSERASFYCLQSILLIVSDCNDPLTVWWGKTLSGSGGIVFGGMINLYSIGCTFVPRNLCPLPPLDRGS